MTDWFHLIDDPKALVDLALPYAMRLVAAVLIFLIGRWVMRAIVRLLDRMMVRANAEPTLIGFVTRVVFIVGMVLVAVSALSRLGVDTTSAAAVLGGAAIAVGLSLQNQLASFAAGVLLILFRPLRVGEWVDIGGKSGTVTEINIFFTTLTSFGNQMVVIPNSQVWSGSIINYDRNSWRRVDLTVAIAYDADLRKAKTILQDILAADPRIRAEPAASVALKTLGDNSVDFAVRFCADNKDWWDLQCETLERIKLRFDAEGIDIPFPQMDLHVKTPARLESGAAG
ncbi:MAG: mechanosensitive ion channel [Gammaproteobacteria bacterium]|nr:mechanosensitive ion channel [Gammaproteobacteria bacterium]